jgi:hypothetical protein
MPMSDYTRPLRKTRTTNVKPPSPERHPLNLSYAFL